LVLSKVHHLAGLISLVAGLIAMVVPKAGLGHRRSGRIALVAMGILIVLALMLLASYLLPDNPSRGRGPQLLLYLLVLAWMAGYSLLAGYRWASPRRSHPIPAWDIGLAALGGSGALVSLLGLVWDLSNPPQYDPALMMGPFGSELTFLLNGGAFLWFAAADLRVLGQSQLSDQERTVKHVVRLTMGIYALVVGVIGGAFGASSSGSLFGYSTKLVRSNSVIERPADSVAGIAKRVLPSVVSIKAKDADGGATGSGFVISSDGYILTNNHVIASAVTSGGSITVRLQDGTSYDATVVGRDTSYDLAVLRVSNRSLPALQFGDSEKVAVGDSVLAIGSPLGLQGTVTLGIISAKDRAVTAGESATDNSFINALQTDAAINPGNSGGPLVDATGAVIGVNSAIATLGSGQGSQTGSIGLGFAIPINQARKTADQLIKNGKATYPIVGVSVDMQYAGDGAKVADTSNAILPGGPAAKAGLRAGDLIVKFDGRTITTPEELIVAIRSKNVGDRVEIEYIRSGKTLTTSLTLTAGK
jgi:putative serine protease PepD